MGGVDGVNPSLLAHDESSSCCATFIGPRDFSHIVDPDTFETDVRDAMANMPHFLTLYSKFDNVTAIDCLRSRVRENSAHIFRPWWYALAFKNPCLERLFALNVSYRASRSILANCLIIPIMAFVRSLMKTLMKRNVINGQDFTPLLHYFTVAVILSAVLLTLPTLMLQNKVKHQTETMCYATYSLMLLLWGVLHYLFRDLVYQMEGAPSERWMMELLTWISLLLFGLGFIAILFNVMKLRCCIGQYVLVFHLICHFIATITILSKHSQDILWFDGLVRLLMYITFTAFSYWLLYTSEFEMRIRFLIWLSTYLSRNVMGTSCTNVNQFVTAAERLHDGLQECKDMLLAIRSEGDLRSADSKQRMSKIGETLEACMQQLRSGDNLYGLSYGDLEVRDEQLEVIDAYLWSTKDRFSSQLTTLRGSADTNYVSRSSLSFPVYSAPSPPLQITPFEDVAYNVLVSDWNFDVLNHFATTDQAFLSIGCGMLYQFEMLHNVDRTTIVSFLSRLESFYLDVPYHNKMHGAMVAQKLLCLANYIHMLEHLNPLDEALLIVSALAHDVGHPARNNSFFVRTQHPVAQLYNDIAVLENYHAANTFRILSTAGCNVFADFDYEYVRSQIIGLILATDTVDNFQMISQFVLMRSSEEFTFEDLKTRMLTSKMLIKAADVAAPTMPWAISQEWVSRLLGEFYAQGAEEAALGLPISALCDRTHHQQAAKSQAAFLKIVVSPLYRSILPLGSVELDQIMRQVESNIERWTGMDTAGDTIHCIECDDAKANLDVSFVLDYLSHKA
ncbi:3'5'-cyclic nucleotide phosphodiesterase, putative [Babesia bigemina]|uniref:Phosphodiesterase n=1 Tax=Babesia bigemina TaxID=5866 RepID=A0A061DAE7_BABBI|nr:3'5'-cyclic nucleotide phosphodiesterase, putative [Babesia bigemina]CDR97676.1 3'5'-cyclic nucleotide phosphodiesterase, putative [Babesia bigemina]|eukprot:XP_012769862.1 3'5'-cyclic nucleotide phosphodiesterase, putative [Babesia bigemina]